MYVIRLQKRKHPSSTWEDVFETEDTIVKVPDLEPDNAYSFRVAARNDDGQSEFSDASETVQLKGEES